MVADQIVFADLGAETPDGFRPLSALGFGDERYPVDAELAGNSHVEPKGYSAPS